jgi:hypothetical protein
MSETQLSREKYEELISEDIEWLRQQPETLWRNHIESILRESANLIYQQPLQNYDAFNTMLSMTHNLR